MLAQHVHLVGVAHHHAAILSRSACCQAAVGMLLSYIAQCMSDRSQTDLVRCCCGQVFWFDTTASRCSGWIDSAKCWWFLADADQIQLPSSCASVLLYHVQVQCLFVSARCVQHVG